MTTRPNIGSKRGEIDTSSDASEIHRSRCLGWTRKDASKEAKLHGRQCPLRASLEAQLSHFLLTRPKRGGWLLSPPQPRGKSNARYRGSFAHPSTEQVNYSKMPLQIARAGFRNFRPNQDAVKRDYGADEIAAHLPRTRLSELTRRSSATASSRPREFSCESRAGTSRQRESWRSRDEELETPGGKGPDTPGGMRLLPPGVSTSYP